MSLITELPLADASREASPEVPQVGSDADNNGASPKQQLSRSPSQENSVSEMKMGEDAMNTTNSNTSSNELSSTGGRQQSSGPRPPKKQKVGQSKGISKVRLVGDPTVVALEARVAERRAADKIRDEKIRMKIHTMEADRVRRETQLAELKKAEAEAAHQAKEAQFRRKHEEHLAAETARKLRCSTLLKCDMDIIKGKKSVTARFDDRKAELKKIEDEDLIIAKWQRHETCATGKNFYDKLHEHQVTVKAKVEADALDRTGRKLPDVPPLPADYMNKVRDQFLRLEAQRKAENRPDLSMTLSQGKRSNMIQYAQAVQKEIRSTMQTVPMVYEEEKKTVPRESMTAKDRLKEGNMAIHRPPPVCGLSGGVNPQHTCWAHS